MQGWRLPGMSVPPLCWSSLVGAYHKWSSRGPLNSKAGETKSGRGMN